MRRPRGSLLALAVTAIACSVSSRAQPRVPEQTPAHAPVARACDNAGVTRISAIQGAGTMSPMVGRRVVVSGQVIAAMQTRALNGFFVQAEPPAQDRDPRTSEGLFVHEGSLQVPLEPGARVRVTGTVVEYAGLTELSEVTSIERCGAAPLPAPQTLHLPLATNDALERHEGMLVHIPERLTVTGNYELGRYGTLELSVNGRLFAPTHGAAPGPAARGVRADNERRRILLDDAKSAQNPAPLPYRDAEGTRRLGDTVESLTGVLDGRHGRHRIQPTAPIRFERAQPRPLTPAAVGGRLRVAAFNVLSYFSTLDAGGARCGPTRKLECRGANTANELERQRAKLVRALAGLDADVLGLIEIENDASSAATASLVRALNAQAGPQTYAFIDTGALGSDAIKLALLYKPARVTPAGAYAILDRRVDPRFLARNRPSLLQTFRERTSGARFSVALNHWKSKGSACKDDPDRNDGQGNCNETRTAAARALADWLKTDPTRSGDPDVLILGDLNAHAREDPLSALADAGYLSLPERFAGPTVYTYQFQGESGALDHALASESLAAQITGAIVWHINADEPIVLDYNTEHKKHDGFDPSTPFRSSDHDPILVGVALTP
jgi:predicted extracellular nuclease